MIPGATCADPAARLRVHRRSSSREMEQVLHVADSLHLARLPDEVLDQFRPRHLSAQLDDPVLHVDVELALRDVRVAEDLAADLVRERGVVEVLRLFLEVLNLLRDAVRLCGDAAAGACRLPAARAEEPSGAVDGEVSPPSAALRIEEVDEERPQRSAQCEHSHYCLLFSLSVRLPGDGSDSNVEDRSLPGLQ